MVLRQAHYRRLGQCAGMSPEQLVETDGPLRDSRIDACGFLFYVKQMSWRDTPRSLRRLFWVSVVMGTFAILVAVWLLFVAEGLTTL